MAINYTIANTFTPNTVISSSEVNQNFSDNANTWTGIEAMTKTFSHIKMDADPGTALEVATKQYVDNSVIASLVGGGKNRILNGEMLIDQNKEGGQYTTASGAAIYCLDQWRIEATGSAVFVVNKSTESQPNASFPNVMKILVTTPGSPAHGDGVNLEYPMDPVYQRDFAWGTSTAKTVTLSFYALCSQTGTYSISFLNGVNSRSYVTTYNLSANLWTYVTVTVPGDTGGTALNWPTSGPVFGLKIVWDMGSGSDVTTSTLNAWQAGSKWKATGSANVTTAANAFYLTAVQLEIGSSATAFEVTPYPLMLQQVQRYYWKTFEQGTAVAQNAGATGALAYVAQIASTTAGGGIQVRYPTQLLGAPVLTFYNPSAANAKWRNLSGATDSGTAAEFNGSSGGIFIQNPQAASDAAGAVLSVHVTANARLGGS